MTSSTGSTTTCRPPTSPQGRAKSSESKAAARRPTIPCASMVGLSSRGGGVRSRRAGGTAKPSATATTNRPTNQQNLVVGGQTAVTAPHPDTRETADGERGVSTRSPAHRLCGGSRSFSVNPPHNPVRLLNANAIRRHPARHSVGQSARQMSTAHRCRRGPSLLHRSGSRRHGPCGAAITGPSLSP